MFTPQTPSRISIMFMIRVHLLLTHVPCPIIELSIRPWHQAELTEHRAL